ncbi:MAG: PAS domain-containing protein [Parvibaculum sp.]|uniref:PAS domain-containing protein n=1 Tax=Parvibaculum sp. TaxID=2024848 RepID=UPI00284AC8E5|nr:PAS domain-containing protein [Parvibaculum sp.]MDR3498584.1 PAS domain-containing protein [Parvibaculum sp.]
MLNEPTLATGASQVDYEVVEVGAPAHPKNQFILAYWRERLNADAIVLRRDVDPVDLKKVLGGVFIVEPVDGGKDLLYRLVGSQNERRIGMKCTGRRFTECYSPRMAAEQIAFHMEVFARGRPAFLRGRLTGLDLEHVNFEACYLPIVTDAGTPQMLGGLYDLAEPE